MCHGNSIQLFVPGFMKVVKIWLIRVVLSTNRDSSVFINASGLLTFGLDKFTTRFIYFSFPFLLDYSWRLLGALWCVFKMHVRAVVFLYYYSVWVNIWMWYWFSCYSRLLIVWTHPCQYCGWCRQSFSTFHSVFLTNISGFETLRAISTRIFFYAIDALRDCCVDT